MKFRLMFLFAIGFSLSAQSQLDWVGNLTFTDESIDLQKTKRNQFLLILKGHDEDGFTVFDSTGNQITSILFNPLPGWSQFYEMIEMPDSTIVFLADLIGCGFILPSLVHYDNGWVEQPVFANNFGHRDMGDVLSDGSIVTASSISREVDRRLLNGTQIWQNQFPDHEIYDIETTALDDIILATDKGLVIMENDGTIVTTLSQLIFQRIEVYDSNFVIGQKLDSLAVFSHTLELLGSIGFPGEPVQDFDLKNATLAVLTAQAHVYIFDSLLSLQSDFAITAESKFEHICLADNGVALSGTERFGDSQWYKGNSSIFVKIFGLDGSVDDFSRDIGIVNIEHGSGPSISHPNYFKVVYPDIKVTVQNHGDETVEKLQIRARFSRIIVSSQDCEVIEQMHTKNFDNLLIHPGETAELTWGNQTIFTESTPPSVLNLCMWTSLPDGKIDENSANDVFCLETVVSDKEAVFSTIISISPNPAPGTTTLRYTLPSSTNAEARLSDALGRTLAIFPLKNAQGEILLENLPAGLHFVTLVVEGHVVGTEKVVVVR